MKTHASLVGLVVCLQYTTAMAQPAPSTHTNRLSHEKSPYLLQHAHNPVDWYPWGPDAFERARQEQKPILLSIGYSTCYWCHVMEQESFEDPRIAQLMNESFVSIKVDREERPDLDALYMAAVQALSGQGGWPMTVFLTPEGKPFWGGTYFPPEDRWGRPGFPTVLRSIARMWADRRAELVESGEQLAKAIQAASQASVPSAIPAPELLVAGAEAFAQQYDPVHGGFGSAPKFPQAHSLSFLLRAWYRTRDARVLDMVEVTLDAMDRGGIHDHVGGGFHRYSTDAQWLVPHFEKMLYDQALLSRAYVEAYQATGRERYARTARDIFDYVLRDLRDPTGALYAAEDAGPVGEEGMFYVWTAEEIDRILDAKSASLIKRFYGVTAGGNFSPEHGGAPRAAAHPPGLTVLAVEVPLEAFAEGERLSVEELSRRLDEARAALLSARAKRPRPHRDDKVLTDWNGLMIGALALGGRALQEPRYIEAARDAAVFLLSALRPQGQLRHRYRDGEAAIPAFLDDYAALAGGLLDLFEATGEAAWLNEASALAQEMLTRFGSDAEGGLAMTSPSHEALVARLKEFTDGALPSGNAMAAADLARLWAWTGRDAFERPGRRLAGLLMGHAQRVPQGHAFGLIALDEWIGPRREVVLAGSAGDPLLRDMRRVFAQRFLPRAEILVRPDTSEAVRAVDAVVPWAAGRAPADGRACVYICENHVCGLPMTSLEDVRRAVDAWR